MYFRKIPNKDMFNWLALVCAMLHLTNSFPHAQQHIFEQSMAHVLLEVPPVITHKMLLIHAQLIYCMKWCAFIFLKLAQEKRNTLCVLLR